MKMDDVYSALRKITHPELEKDIVSDGFVKDITVEGNRVILSLMLPETKRNIEGELRKLIEDAVKAIPWADMVEIQINYTGVQKARPRGGISKKREIPGVRHVIAVTSGKGGVGKSTVAANLALALEQLGYKVGLFDGDIYGPSIPKMFGIERFLPRVENNKMIPVERYGIKILSIGLMIEEDTPVIWRGPLVHKAYEQFFFDSNWGELDFLVVDFPPGTGDPQISAAQLTIIRGGIAVTTPQDVSIQDVKKAIRMLEKMDVPVIGVVENMSYFKCPKCGYKSYIFGTGGGEKIEKEMGVKLLGQIPIDPKFTSSGDTGIPVMILGENLEVKEVFKDVARKVAEKAEELEKIAAA